MGKLSGKLVIATHNAGKLREIAALLAPYGLECVSAGDLGLPEPAETGVTFAENALIKARSAAEASGFPALADDSGLCVAALSGRPRTAFSTAPTMRSASNGLTMKSQMPSSTARRMESR